MGLRWKYELVGCLLDFLHPNSLTHIKPWILYRKLATPSEILNKIYNFHVNVDRFRQPR